MVTAGFKKRRILNWLSCGILYAFFYMARYNFAAVSARLADVFGWSNTQLGVLSTVGTLVYGLAVFLNGPLADSIGGRRAILIGAGGAAVFNLLFGLSHLLLAQPAVWAGTGAERHVAVAAQIQFGMSATTLLSTLATVWALNYYFQSFGALSIVKINAAWFAVRERGTFSGIFGILIRFGLILAFFGSPFVLTVLPWQWVFWVPALAIAVLIVWNLIFLRDTPEAAGAGEYDTGDESAAEKATPASLSLVLRKVFASGTMWNIAAASMMLGFVRRGVVDEWWPKYFANVFHVNSKLLFHFAPYQVAAWGMAIAGIAGGIAFGMLSDRLFAGRRAPIVVIAFLAQAATLAGFAVLTRMGAGAFASAAALVVLAFFVNGAHGIVGGAASMDFGGRKAAATATGLLDGMQYAAGSLVGVGMGKLLDSFGWSVWPLAPIPFALVGALLMSRLWNVVPAAHRQRELGQLAGTPNAPAAAAGGR
jgi:OPA family glycerol-3-phosphate transporter-like MFS transporter